jgi:hypothetical protein
MDDNKGWTRQELLLALNLYFKIPFGQYRRENKRRARERVLLFMPCHHYAGSS